MLYLEKQEHVKTIICKLLLFLLLAILVLGLRSTTTLAYTGSQEDGYTVTSAADLANLLTALNNSEEHYPVFYESEGTFSIDRNLTLPANVSLYLNSELTVKSDCTLTVEGSMQGLGEINTSQLTVESGGQLINNGALHLSGSAYIYGSTTNGESGWLSTSESLYIYGTMTNSGAIEVPHTGAANMSTGIFYEKEGGTFTITEDGVITWLCDVTTQEAFLSTLNELEERMKLHPLWNQSAEILINGNITLTDNLTVPEYICLNVNSVLNGEEYCVGSLTIPNNITLTTKGVTFLQGPAVIQGTWISENTICIRTDFYPPDLYYGCASLTLAETGTYQGVCIQLDTPDFVPDGAEWSWILQLPGFREDMFDEIINEYQSIYFLRFSDVSTDNTTQNLSDDTPQKTQDENKSPEQAPSQPEALAEGTFGLSTPFLFWRLDSDGTLTVFGTGAIPDYQKVSGAPWYQYRNQVQKIVLEEGVTGIGDYAFAGCSNAVSITAPESSKLPLSLTSVGNYAFLNCSSLKELYFLENTTNVAFSTMDCGCSSLVAIRFDRKNPTYWSSYGVVYTKDRTEFLRLPPAYSGTFTVKDTVTSIAAGAFGQCDKLTSLTFPDSVSKLGLFIFQTGKDTPYPAKLNEVFFKGDAPDIGTLTFTKNQEKENFTIYYYEDAAGWDKILTMDCADYITFKSQLRSVDLRTTSYLVKEENSSTMKGSQSFKNSVSKLDKELFVNSLTAVSLANADKETADVIRGQIYNLLYESTFRPTQFQKGNSNANIKKWQIQNAAHAHNQLPSSQQTPKGDISSIKITNDAGLQALGTKQVTWTNGAYGCYSYGRFASAYVYGTNGVKRGVTSDPSTSTLKKLFNQWLDPGETIYYTTTSGYTHALVFLGESMDNEGFYYISYGGGDYPLIKNDKYQYKNVENGKKKPIIDYTADTMDIGFFPYKAFAKVTTKVTLWDTNGTSKSGSYVKGTAKNVKINSKTLCGQVTTKNN